MPSCHLDSLTVTAGAVRASLKANFRQVTPGTSDRGPGNLGPSMTLSNLGERPHQHNLPISDCEAKTAKPPGESQDRKKTETVTERLRAPDFAHNQPREQWQTVLGPEEEKRTSSTYKHACRGVERRRRQRSDQRLKGVSRRRPTWIGHVERVLADENVASPSTTMVSPAKAIDVSDYRRTCKPVHEKMHASDNRHLVVIAIISKLS